RRNAVCGEEQSRSLGHFCQIVDEHGPLPAKAIDDVPIVDDLVIDVDRRAVKLNRQIERVDRHVDAGAEAPRAGKEDLHSYIILATTDSKNVAKVCEAANDISYTFHKSLMLDGRRTREPA